MESKIEIIKLIDDYRNSFDDELNRTEPILTFLNSFEGSQLFDRKNFVGHITASAYIINQSKKSILLLKHKTLNRWLQPGGHIDATDSSIMDAALREVKEETGISSSLLFPVSTSVFDVDSHPIPENIKKAEPAHYHHDISFLFVCADFHIINIDPNESTAGNWVSIAELSQNSSYTAIFKKIDKLMR